MRWKKLLVYIFIGNGVYFWIKSLSSFEICIYIFGSKKFLSLSLNFFGRIIKINKELYVVL